MGRFIGIIAGALAVAAASQPSPAYAQYMPHLDPNLYMLTMMNMGGGASAGQLDIDRQSDPLAAAGNRLDAQPLRFYRGGSGATALGQWAVLGADGEVAGVYTGFFTRSNKLWKLRELTLSASEEIVEPAAQYCVKPGDVIEHRLTSTKNWRESAAKSVDEAKTKLDTATVQVAAAEAAAVTDPKSSGPAKVLRDAKASQVIWTKQLEKREKNLADALEKSAEAEKDAAEIKRLTGPARTALAFRVAEEEKVAEKTAATN